MEKVLAGLLDKRVAVSDEIVVFLDEFATRGEFVRSITGDVSVAAEDIAFVRMADVQAAVGASGGGDEPCILLHDGAIARISVGDNQ